MIWKKVTLGDIASNIQTGPFGSQLHQSDYSEEGTPVVMPKDLVNGHISELSIARVSEDHVNRLSRHKIEVGDILYSRRGDVGRCAFATNLERGWLCGTGCLRVTIDSSKAVPKFVFYQLQKAETVGWVEKHAVGATMLNLNTSILSSIPIEMPSIEEQQIIVDMLSAYDDLIENNQKQIKLLEEAAQRLYKEWFVDLRFPGHETTPITDGIPEEWEKSLLSDIIGYEIGGGWGEEEPTEKCDIPAYVIRGTDLYGISHGDSLGIPYRYHAEKNLNARKLSDGDIVFEVSGGSKTEGVARTALIRSAMLEQWGDAVMCASFCKLIRVKDQNHAQLLFDAFQYMRASGKTTEYDKRSASSIVNYRWKDFLSTETVLIPDEKMLAKYNALASNMYDLIIQKSIAIEKAKDARDRLLPKLMNGEIEV